jgi:hypothetical protein
MALLRGCIKFKAWQPQVVDVDGQLAVSQVVSSPRSKAADRECLKTLSWIITYYSANNRFREDFQS